MKNSNTPTTTTVSTQTAAIDISVITNYLLSFIILGCSAGFDNENEALQCITKNDEAFNMILFVT